MARSRAYTRDMRNRKIARKKYLSNCFSHLFEVPFYECDGLYNKNKIHCSCPLCSAKTNNRKSVYHGGKLHNNWKASDIKKLMKLEYE